MGNVKRKNGKRRLKHSEKRRRKCLTVFVKLLMILVIAACVDISGAKNRELSAAVVDTADRQTAGQNGMPDNDLVFRDTDGGVMAARTSWKSGRIVLPCRGF